MLIFMKKLPFLLKSCSVLTAVFSVAVAAVPNILPSAPEVAAKGYVLLDYNSGKVLAQHNAHDRLDPASLTKIMTSYVIGQEIAQGNISPDDDVVISNKAWAKNFPDSSKMFVEVGTSVKVADLNRGIIIQSGNDACVAMAEHIAGSEESFVDLMNGWAQKIGLKDTHFTNSHGLDNPNLYSTSYELALLSQALIRDVPEEYAIYKEKSFTYNGITQYNRNGLLWDKSLNVDGMKTGYTSKAGYNLVSSATEGNMRLIAVVIGTSSANARKAESKKLLNYGFRFFETISPHKANETFVTEKVWMGNTDKVPLGVAKDTFITLPRGMAKQLEASFVLEKHLEAPIQKGDVIGKLFYKLGDNVEAEYPLVALANVEQGGLFSRLVDFVVMFVKNLFR